MRNAAAVILSISLCAAPQWLHAEPTAHTLPEACLAEAADAQAARACIGRIAATCIDDDGGVTTMGMIQCQERERAAWRAMRDASVASLQARESPLQRALLHDMLEGHERWGRVRCAYGASIYEGGSLGRVVAAACLNRLEAELAIDLHERLAEYDER